MKSSVQQEDGAIINIYTPFNNIPLKHMKQKFIELKREIESSTIMVGDFQTLFSIIDCPTRQ